MRVLKYVGVYIASVLGFLLFLYFLARYWHPGTVPVALALGMLATFTYWLYDRPPVKESRSRAFLDPHAVIEQLQTSSEPVPRFIRESLSPQLRARLLALDPFTDLSAEEKEFVVRELNNAIRDVPLFSSNISEEATAGVSEATLQLLQSRQVDPVAVNRTILEDIFSDQIARTNEGPYLTSEDIHDGKSLVISMKANSTQTLYRELISRFSPQFQELLADLPRKAQQQLPQELKEDLIAELRAIIRSKSIPYELTKGSIENLNEAETVEEQNLRIIRVALPGMVRDYPSGETSSPDAQAEDVSDSSPNLTNSDSIVEDTVGKRTWLAKLFGGDEPPAEEPQRSLLKFQHLLKPDKLVEELRYNTNKNISRFLRGRLDLYLLNSLHENYVYADLSEREQEVTLNEINKALDGPPLLTSELSPGFALRNSTAALLRSARPDVPAPKLNQSLLEDAFPKAIKKVDPVPEEKADERYFRLAKYRRKDIINPKDLTKEIFELRRPIDETIWNEIPENIQRKLRENPERKAKWIARIFQQRRLAKILNSTLKLTYLRRRAPENSPADLLQALDLKLESFQFTFLNRRLIDEAYRPHLRRNMKVRTVLQRWVDRDRGLMGVSDIRNFKSLILELRRSSDEPVVQELISRFSPGMQKRIFTSIPRPSDMTLALIRDLNRIMRSVAIYNEVPRDEIKISEATAELLGQTSTEGISVEANLAFLADAFPGIILHPSSEPLPLPIKKRSPGLRPKIKGAYLLGEDPIRIWEDEIEEELQPTDLAELEEIINTSYERYCFDNAISIESADTASKLSFLLQCHERNYSTLRETFTNLNTKYERLSMGLKALGTDSGEIVRNYEEEHKWLLKLSDLFCELSDGVCSRVLGEEWEDLSSAVEQRNAARLSTTSSFLLRAVSDYKVQATAFWLEQRLSNLQKINALIETVDEVANTLALIGRSGAGYDERLLGNTDLEVGRLAGEMAQLYVDTKQGWVEELIEEIRKIESIADKKPEDVQLTEKETRALHEGFLNWFLSNKRERAITKLMRLDQIVETYCKDSGDPVADNFYKRSRQYHAAIERLVDRLSGVGIHLARLTFFEPIPDEVNPFKEQEGEPRFFNSPYLQNVARSKAMRLDRNPSNTLVDVSLWGYRCDDLPELDRDSAGWLLVGW